MMELYTHIVQYQVVFEGCSEHCFMSTEGKLIRLREEYPELNELLVSLAMRDK